jgi:hypothetical protein
MITIYDKNNEAYIIRPCPIINISWVSNSNEGEQLGGKYDITLNGTLLPYAGSPIFKFDNRNNDKNGIEWTPSYYPSGPGSKPPAQEFSVSGNLGSLLSKQIALQELFSNVCQKIEVASVNPGDQDSIITFYPKFLGITFDEGIWVNRCDYSINLESVFMTDRRDNVIAPERYATEAFGPGSPGWPANNKLNLAQFLQQVGGFIDDLQETWSIESEDGNGNTVDPYSGSENITKVYRLTRNVTAKGQSIKSLSCFAQEAGLTNIDLRSHEQARRYVQKYLEGNSQFTNAGNQHDRYLSSGIPPAINFFASGLLNLSAAHYGGYNHSRSENIDVSQGTYSVQDTWILSSGNAYENYNLSLSFSQDNPRKNVTIEGVIKGLSSIPASGTVFGGNHPSTFNTAYENAINKYRAITSSGQFGLNAHVFKRAQNAAGGFTLNEIPLAVSVGTNEFTGEINYSIQYDNRPRNLIGGPNTAFENITISDTYPGDVFAVIPVIGRPTGPVLQYIGGRTEYQRTLSLEMVVNTDSQPPRTGGTLVPAQTPKIEKPSIGPQRTGIINLIRDYSPAREPGIRKFFVSPPQETWDPKEGRYTLSITWTYELNY